MTECLKGICLILMFIHHFFQFPKSYIEGIAYPNLAGFEKYQGHFQICVAGFAFLTGYFYAFSKHKNLKYSIQKILGLYIGYWVVLAFMTCVALVTRTLCFSTIDFVLEILAVKCRVLCFCWYVVFYLFAMLYLPLIVLIAKDNLVLWLLLGLIVPICLYIVARRYIAPLEKFQVYFPILTVGVLCGKYNLFQRMNSLINKYARGCSWITIMVSLIMILIVFFEPGWLYHGPQNLIFNMIRKIIRIASIPWFIYGLIQLLELIKWEIALLPLRIIGRYSMLLWFLHGGFFNVSKSFTQPILFWPHNPLLVTIWGLVFCLGFAWILDRPVKWFISKLSVYFK